MQQRLIFGGKQMYGALIPFFFPLFLFFSSPFVFLFSSEASYAWSPVTGWGCDAVIYARRGGGEGKGEK